MVAPIRAGASTLATLWSRPAPAPWHCLGVLATAAALVIMAFKAEEPGQLSRVDDFATSAPKDKPAQPAPAATSLDRPKSAARSAGGGARYEHCRATGAWRGVADARAGVGREDVCTQVGRTAIAR